MTDNDDSVLVVDVVVVERNGLSHPHAGHGQKPDQGPARRGGTQLGAVRFVDNLLEVVDGIVESVELASLPALGGGRSLQRR